MAYIAHRRAAVWWGYRCVLSLLEELKENPAQERDIADIGADLNVTVPDWANIELPPPNPAIDSETKAALAEIERQHKAAEAVLDPEIHSFVKEAVEIAFREFRSVHGIHPIDLLKKAGQFINAEPVPIDPASPALVEAAKLKAQLGQVQKDAVDTIKSVLPSKLPAVEKKKRDNALNAVYRWTAAPDAENSQKCLDIGNECPDTPAGLLSLASFWAYGDLMPMGEQTVPTPPGLAANGLCQVLLLCALHQGGTRKVKERFAEYFRLGVEVLTGADNWEPSLAAGKAPHQEESGNGAINGAAAVVPAQQPENPPEPAAEAAGRGSPPVPPPVYKRWKPGDMT